MIEALIVAIAGLLGIIWAFIKGREEGVKQEQGKQAKKVVEDVAKAKEVADDVRNLSADDRRERLSKYTKQ